MGSVTQPVVAPTGHVTIGVDVGQKSDPTAIAVVQLEAQRRQSFATDWEWLHKVMFLRRIPLGTNYVDVADLVRQVVDGVRNRTESAVPTLFLDATGVGTPIVDALRRARVEASLQPVYFTHGDRRVLRLDKHSHVPYVSLGKAWLVSRLQTLLQQRRILLPPSLTEADVLKDELLNYEIRVDENANDRYGAFKVGKHDDLVTALGLAVQIEAGDPEQWRGERFRTQPILPGVF